MDGESRLYRIDPSTKVSKPVSEVDFTSLGLRERRDIQEWIVANPSILGENLLVIAKEFSGFDRTNERADVICIDQDGNLVVVELKRDDSGSDVHWQAIKYASYFHDASPEDIVSMLARHEHIGEEEAGDRLRQHIELDDLDHLNSDQRVLLVSHRFAPEVTSAVLWLNQKAAKEYFITCLQLTPFHDPETGSTYIQSSTIIPVPGTDSLKINLGVAGKTVSKKRGPAKKQDEITRFLRDVATRAIENVDEEIRPDKRSRWAGIGGNSRYFNIWYSSPPWGPGAMMYRMFLSRENESSSYSVIVRFTCDKASQVKGHLTNDEWLSEADVGKLEDALRSLEVPQSDGAYVANNGRLLRIDVGVIGQDLEEAFGDDISRQLRELINVVTPLVKEVVEAGNAV